MSIKSKGYIIRSQKKINHSDINLNKRGKSLRLEKQEIVIFFWELHLSFPS